MFLLEFPQNLIGFTGFTYFVRKKNRPFYRYKEAYVVHIPGRWGAVSLSRYIFADDAYYHSEMIKHEYGHTIQSRKLLFLYLLVIGLPSYIWSRLFKHTKIRQKKSYYWLYTESWANQLGGYRKNENKTRGLTRK